jgi:hypothetical protein
MNLKNWLGPAIGALAAGFLTLPAHAAVGGVAAASDLRTAGGANAGVERVHGGYRYYYRPHYGYYDYPRYRYHRYHRHHRHHHHHRYRDHHRYHW